MRSPELAMEIVRLCELHREAEHAGSDAKIKERMHEREVWRKNLLKGPSKVTYKFIRKSVEARYPLFQEEIAKKVEDLEHDYRMLELSEFD